MARGLRSILGRLVRRLRKPIHARGPTLRDSLRTLKDCGLGVRTVLDVGVLSGTPPLIEAYPEARHHLFEPARVHFPEIRRRYRRIDHELHEVAVSDTEGTCYLTCRSIVGGGRVTHAEIGDRPRTAADVSGFISCDEIPKRTLDSILEGRELRRPVLLKIDVDGHELPVLRGAARTLEASTIVVLEAPLTRGPECAFFERANFVRERGFELVDVVDPAYYDGILWQADLVFLRSEEIRERPRLRPFQGEEFRFDGRRWDPLGERL